MKNKILLICSLLMVLIISGCGNKNNTSTTTESTSIDTEKEIQKEEVIGDVDITRDITIDDCQEMILGSDLVIDYSSFPEERKEAWNTLGRTDLKVLFPKGEFITSQDNANIAKSEKISVEVTAEPIMNNSDVYSNENILINNEKYIVIKDVDDNASDDDSYFYIVYMIYDLKNNAHIKETVVINKFDIEYANKFIDEYIPKFEETLVKNFD